MTKPKKSKPKFHGLTLEEASIILYANDIDVMLENPEEVELLEMQNPELLDAYRTLKRIADGE